MPECRLCNNSFKIRAVIDGKVKNLQHRKYCLDCSPFRKHNTKKLEKAFLPEEAAVCRDCGKEYVYKRSKGHLKIKCNSCSTAGRRLEVKKKCVEYCGGKCVNCGYSKCLRAMVFHHTDPGKKDFAVASNMRASWKVIKQELDKCVLLCANCHAEEHAAEFQGG